MKSKEKEKARKKKRPLISFVTPMKEKDFRVIKLLESIRKQNYPQDRIEIIITDGGSNPEVLKACEKHNVKIYPNPKGFAEGAGMGKDQGIWRAKGKYVVIAESDIEFIEDDWIESMSKPLEENEELFASVPRLYIHPNDNTTNKYLSYVGVDPFALYRALDGQLELNKVLMRKIKEPYFVLELDEKKPYCMGSNGFMFRRELIKKVGDYAQDIEFIARLAKGGYRRFTVVENAHVWHKNVKGLMDFIKKRVKWTRNYTKVYIKEKKEFNWIVDRKEFFLHVIKNLMIFPNAAVSIERAVDKKNKAWLLHAPLLFFSTALNIFFALNSKEMFGQVF